MIASVMKSASPRQTEPTSSLTYSRAELATFGRRGSRRRRAAAGGSCSGSAVSQSDAEKGKGV